MDRWRYAAVLSGENDVNPVPIMTMVFALLLPAVKAQAQMQWDESGGTHGAHGTHARVAGPRLRLVDGQGADTAIVLPTLERRALPLRGGGAGIPATGFDNYHLLLAVRETPSLYEAALRYQFLRGRPSGHSPAELVNARKIPLEIVPAPLAREHSHYLSRTAPAFVLRFEGTRLYTRSDGDGRVSFPLPDDFGGDVTEQARRRPADFVVTTRYETAGREYRTTLSAPYYLNPEHWQSTGRGLWSASAGFVAGLGLLLLVGRRGGAVTGKA